MNEYSIKDMADLVGVSKTAIRKTIKASGIECDRIEKNKQIFSYDKTKKIIKLIRNDFDLSVIETENHELKTENHESETENPNAIKHEENGIFAPKNENKTENCEPQTENQKNESQTNEEILILKSVIKTIQEQIEIKDKQIAAYQQQIENKDKQIADYSERLREALELTKGQQYISAADKTAQLIDKGFTSEAAEEKEESLETQEEIPKKKSFWKRIFG